MKHSIEWQDDALNAAPEERATVGDLRLFIGRFNATQHVTAGKVHNHVTIALYHLASGLAHDWWTIFGRRDRPTSITKYRCGYLLPDLRLAFDGAAFEMVAPQYTYADNDVRFLDGPAEVMTREAAEAWLESLIEEVLARLKSCDLPNTGAALRWQRVKASRRSHERLFCEAAGSLGLDPYQITDEVAAFIEAAERLFDGEALVEFVSGSEGVRHARLLRWVERMASSKTQQYRLADLDAVAAESRARAGNPRRPEAWARGYRLARAARKILAPELKSSPNISFRVLADALGGGQSYTLAPSVDGIRALRREWGGSTHVHVRNHGDDPAAEATNLFAMARAVGDTLCFADGGLIPINDAQYAYRQAAGRAFAAEFLAPIDEIRSMIESGRDRYSIADALHVLPEVIDRQIENRTRIDEACA